MQSLLILGRQPAIGLAELESLYGADKVVPAGNNAAIVDVDPCLLAFDRLGGSIKFCKVLVTVSSQNWPDIERYLIDAAPKHSQSMPPGKMLLGISAYDFSLSYKQVLKTAIALKQAIRVTGRSVRVVPNKENALSSAQVFHNRLTSVNGWELVIVRDKHQTVIAQTVKVQNISAYAKRDQARPARDPKVGMLPPKLAQIMINLGVGKLPPESLQSVCEIPPDQPIPAVHFKDSLLLDAFCGTGVVVQEALIMGYNCLGTDINPRMIDYAKQNLEWLKNLPRSPIGSHPIYSLALGDATTYQWPEKPSVVVSETYLGKPLAKQTPDSQLKPMVIECDRIIREFLDNIGDQIAPGTRLCLAVPAWLMSNGEFRHLPLLDSLGVIGYNRVSFQHSGAKDLIYFRRNQVVARELLVLTRK